MRTSTYDLRAISKSTGHGEATIARIIGRIGARPSGKRGSVALYDAETVDQIKRAILESTIDGDAVANDMKGEIR